METTTTITTTTANNGCRLCQDSHAQCQTPCCICSSRSEILKYYRGIDHLNCSWKICPEHIPEWKALILNSDQPDDEKNLRLN